MCARQQKFGPEKREFMEKYVEKLSALGIVVPTELLEWVSAPNIVPTKPPAIFRMALDLRPVNTVTVPTFWAVPKINNDLSHAKKSKCFWGIDICSGFWKLLLEARSQLQQAHTTSRGVVQPTRASQGAINSVANFH